MGTGRAAFLAAGLLAIVLIVAGCGGGGGEDLSTSSLTKVQFIKKMEAVCQGGNKRMEAALAAYLTENKKVKHPSKADFVALVGKVVVPNLRKEIKEIRALGAPSGDGDEVEAILVALEEGLETAEDDPKVAASSSSAVFGISSRLAEEYGLKVCGSR